MFHHKAHPSTLSAADVSAFLTWLATSRHVSVSTQNQALAALLCLYQHVLQMPIGRVEHVVRAKQPLRLPVVLSRDEVEAVLSQLTGTMWIVGMLLYGSGVRLEECPELRVKDVDFDRHQAVVRRGKGKGSDDGQHARDVEAGVGQVALPDALARKYPNAAREWAWQFVFPASRICRDARWGPPSRFHLHQSAVQKGIARAVRRSGVAKRLVRTRFVTALRRICLKMDTILLNRGTLGVKSPADRLVRGR